MQKVTDILYVGTELKAQEINAYNESFPGGYRVHIVSPGSWSGLSLAGLAKDKRCQVIATCLPELLSLELLRVCKEMDIKVVRPMWGVTPDGGQPTITGFEELQNVEVHVAMLRTEGMLDDQAGKLEQNPSVQPRSNVATSGGKQ